MTTELRLRLVALTDQAVAEVRNVLSRATHEELAYFVGLVMDRIRLCETVHDEVGCMVARLALVTLVTHYAGKEVST
jgi:hypothetical protein